MHKQKLKIFGLIGYPLGHTLSPYMHNAAFAKLKIKAVYVPISVEHKKLRSSVALLKKMKVSGFNVTIPHKSACIKYLDSLDKTAKNIGAVNTVAVKGNKLIGYNTDAPGFIKSLESDLSFKPKKKAILLVGAGGAGRAVAFALAGEKADKIFISDIKTKRSKSLALDINKHFSLNKAKSAKIKDIDFKKINLVVNASPIGMKKTDPLPINLDLLDRKTKIYDIVYNPAPTRLVLEAKNRKMKAVNGIGMLLYQGALAFHVWTNKKPPVKVMKKALINSLKKRK